MELTVENLRKCVEDADMIGEKARYFLFLSPIVAKMKGLTDGQMLNKSVQVIVSKPI